MEHNMNSELIQICIDLLQCAQFTLPHFPSSSQAVVVLDVLDVAFKHLF